MCKTVKRRPWIKGHVKVRRSGDVNFVDDLARGMVAVVVAVGRGVRRLADHRTQTELVDELARHASERRETVHSLPVTYHAPHHLATPTSRHISGVLYYSTGPTGAGDNVLG